MVRVALLVPVCSKDQNYTSFENTCFMKNLYASWNETKSKLYEYKIFLGYDDDDTYYKNHRQDMEKYTDIQVVELTGCKNAPAFAWNKLFKEAYDAGYDYFFQIGDDAIINNSGWTEQFIAKLQDWNNCGVVGPCDPVNHFSRIKKGERVILEVSFVSRVHYELFNTYFHTDIQNWYCDDWISEVYKQNNRFYLFSNLTYTNSIRNNRYIIKQVYNLSNLVIYGSNTVRQYLETSNV